MTEPTEAVLLVLTAEQIASIVATVFRDGLVAVDGMLIQVNPPQDREDGAIPLHPVPELEGRPVQVRICTAGRMTLEEDDSP